MSSQPGKGSFAERHAQAERRKEEALERDEARARLMSALEEAATVAIPAGKGFEVVRPGQLASADGVVTAANELIDGIGHDRLMVGAKAGVIARDLVPPESLTLESPYMRFALDEQVVGPVANYLGLVPVLYRIDVWYSAPSSNPPKSSQLWHLDPAETTQVKVWVHCADVGADSGPLTVVDRTTSSEIAERAEYDYSKEPRIKDKRFRELVAETQIVPLEGPAGTVDFVDTSSCFHYGSRVPEHGTPRRVAFFQYLTPYSVRFKSDHREEAPFRALASGASSELEHLVLGAA